MERICVFCGSSPGQKPEYIQAAKGLGVEFVRRDIGLVYGGGRLGMMGAIARTIHEHGGKVIGVIPEELAKKNVALTELSDLRIVSSMHERKALMAELADGFIALPGGLGTIEEIFEVITWAQLSIHRKPCGFLNVAQYYEKLIDFLDYAVEQQFIETAYRAMIVVEEHPAALLSRFETYQPPKLDKAEWALGLLESSAPS